MDESGTTQTALERPPPGPPPGLNASDEWPHPRRRWGRLIALVLVALLLVGGGGFAAVRFFAPASDDAIELVPRDSWFYASVFLDPSTSQKRALRDLLEHFPTSDTPDEAADVVADFLDNLLDRIDVSFSEEIEPWLGNQVAVFAHSDLREVESAILMHSEDIAAAEDFVEKVTAISAGIEEPRSYKGIDYQFAEYKFTPDEAHGIVGDFFVQGTERAFKKVIDIAEGDRGSLARSRRYESATRGLEDERLALAYLDAGILVETLVDNGAIPSGVATTPLVTSLSRPLAAVFYAREDSVVFEAKMVVPDRSARSLLALGEGLLADLPAAVWFAKGFDDLGHTATELLDALGEGGLPVGLLFAQVQRETGLDLETDVLAWMGDAGLFLSGRDATTGFLGLAVETSDTRASARAVRTLGSLLNRRGFLMRDATNRSFILQGPGGAQGWEVIASDERVVAAIGEGAAFAALGEGPRLGDAPIFRRGSASLGEGFEPTLFVDVQGLIRWLESEEELPSLNDELNDELELGPHVDPVSYLVAGTRVDGETVIARIVMGVE